MIDKRTGDILIPITNFKIHKGLQKNELESSKFYKDFIRDMRDMKTGYIWYYFSSVSLMHREILFSLCFKNGNLDSVYFCVDSNDLPTSWSNWSEEGELKRKNLNEELLCEIFCCDIKQNSLPSEYHFTWGNVTSYYDPRSGGSSVILRYSNN